MKVYELAVEVYLKKDINLEDVSTYIARFVDMNLSSEKEMYDYHSSRIYKEYCFDGFFPIEEDKRYKKGKIYIFRIRTINEKVSEHFLKKLIEFENRDMKGISVKIKVVPKKLIEKIYTITPILMKTDEGYWGYSMSFEEFEERLTANCLKKYIYFTNKKDDVAIDSELLKRLGEDKSEDVDLFTNIKFINRMPVPIIYKKIKLLGDKVELKVSNNGKAQEIAYMLLGTGLLENCARGCGFLGYRYYK